MFVAAFVAPRFFIVSQCVTRRPLQILTYQSLFTADIVTILRHKPFVMTKGGNVSLVGGQ